MNEENTEPSPWDSLIGDLGIEVNPEVLERHQPTSQEVAKVARDRGEVAPPTAVPSDWFGLASELGIEVPPEEPPRKTESASRKRPDSPRETESRETKPHEPRQRQPRQREPRQVEERPREDHHDDERLGKDRPRGERERGSRRRRDDRDRRDRSRSVRGGEPVEIHHNIEFQEVDELVEGSSPIDPLPDDESQEPEKPRISGEAARSAFDALFSAEAVNWGSAFVSPRTNVESSFLFSEGEEAVFAEDIPDKTDIDDEDEEEEEPKKRPRRRRRGGRGRGRGRKPEQGEATDTEGDDGTEIDESDEVLSDAVEPADVADDGDDAEPEKRRRRRRPRGRGRKSEEGDTRDDEDDSHVRRRIASHVEGGDEGDDDDEGDSGEEARGGHRNLPTWNDAIGVIVDGNLAQRSKAPAKQQNQSRGGRGRGGRRHKKS